MMESGRVSIAGVSGMSGSSGLGFSSVNGSIRVVSTDRTRYLPSDDFEKRVSMPIYGPCGIFFSFTFIESE